MFSCDMFQLCLARADSKYEKLSATDPSSKLRLELQPCIRSYIESGYQMHMGPAAKQGIGATTA